MSEYQSLIESAVASVNALRGCIILRDASTNALEYVATENYEPENGGPVDVNQMLLDLLADPEPRLIDNSIKHNYLPPNIISTLGLMHIILVPLKKDNVVYGLVWCDRFFKQGLFSQEDLARVVALVDQFHEIP
jgi:hypothetical protein